MSARYFCSPGAAQEDAGDRVYVRVAAGEWVVLEGSARYLWTALKQPRTIAELVNSCQMEYEGAASEIELDVIEILQEWEALKIVGTKDLRP